MMKRILLFTIAFIFYNGMAFGQCDSVEQRSALMDLYNKAGGDHWTRNDNWGSEKPFDQWYGVTTNEDGCITELILPKNQLYGQLPKTLGKLTSLEVLDLQRNYYLACKIPKELGDLKRLKKLFLQGNRHIGNIPSELNNLTMLVELNLTYNNLSGNISGKFSNLRNLEILKLRGNILTGNIPKEFSNLIHLKELYLNFNRLTGTIPEEISFLDSLKVFHVRRNRLSGCISETILDKICSIDFTLDDNPELPFLGDVDSLCNRKVQTGAPCDDSNKYTSGDIISENCICEGLPDTSCADRDELILMKIYNSLNGDNWKNNKFWGSLDPLYNWHGITTNSDGCVTKINLLDNNLTGKIPKEIGQLSELKELNLAINKITSEIPKEIGQLTNLRELSLSVNQLSGNIPPELGKLNKLTKLYLAKNNLVGEIPKTLTHLSNLNGIILSSNKLTGKIPIGFGKLQMLKELSFHHNQLEGTIPKDFNQSSKNLGILYLNNNNLSGSIPLDLIKLEGNRRILLDLSHNQLTGIIPPFGRSFDGIIGYDLNFNRIALNDNKLTGPIPSSLGDRSLILDLYLQNNNLSGCFPPEIVQFMCQNDIDTIQSYQSHGYNFLNNPLLPYQGDFQKVCSGVPQKGAPCDDGNPETKNDRIDNDCQCNPLPKCRTRDSTALMSFYTSTQGDNWTYNENWGSIKYIGDWYGIITNLDGCVERLDLTNNQLNGVIPKEIADLSALKFLFLSENELTGSIPTEIGALNQLKYLSLDNNQLSDEIPIEIKDLTSLQGLNISHNMLSGSIPPEIGQIPNLSSISLYNNMINGSIPIEIGQLKELNTLSIQNNQISGLIPKEIGQLSNLIWLNLSNNQLVGNIPSELEACTRLEDIRLSNNNITGNIPEEIGNIENLNWLYLDNNNFYDCIPNNIIQGKCQNGLQFNIGHNPLLPHQGDLSKLCNDVAQIGAPCNDGDPATPIDKIDENCLCNGKTVATNDILYPTKIKIFPNPASNVLHFEIENKSWHGNTNIVFYNLLGEEVRKLVISDASDFLDYRIDIPSGVYFCRVGMQVFKVVISH